MAKNSLTDMKTRAGMRDMGFAYYMKEFMQNHASKRWRARAYARAIKRGAKGRYVPIDIRDSMAGGDA